MVEEWTTCMRLLSWRRHQGTMLKNCVLILPVSDPAKQAVQVVKHHVFDESNQRAAGEIRIRIRKIFSLTNFSEWFFVLLYGIFTLIIIYKNRKYWLYIFIE